jgi:hypothetical protein
MRGTQFLAVMAAMVLYPGLIAAPAWAQSGEIPTFGGMGEPNLGIPGGFLLFAFLWWAVPLVLAAYLARAQKESVGLAVVLTLVFGLIGLVIVWYGQVRSVQVAGRTVRAAADRGRSPGHPPTTPVYDGPMTRAEAAAATAEQRDAQVTRPTPSATPVATVMSTEAPDRSPRTADVATRLRTVDELHDMGLITDAEHAERRSAILAQL